MKFLSVLLFVCAFSASAFGSGKFSIQGNYYEDGKNIKPIVGFGVYEKIFMKSYANLWVGYGVQPLEVKDDVDWFVGKLSVDMHFKRIIVAPGVMYKRLPNTDFQDVIPTIRADFVLW